MIFRKSSQSQCISAPVTELLLCCVNPNLPLNLCSGRWHTYLQRLLSPLILHCHSLQQGLLWGQIWGTHFLFVLLLSFIRIWRNHKVNLKKNKILYFSTPLYSWQSVSSCTLLSSQVWMHTSTTSLFHVIMKSGACWYLHPLNHMLSVSTKPPVISGIWRLSTKFLGLKLQRPGIEDGSWEHHGFLCTSVDGYSSIKMIVHDTAHREFTVKQSTISLL